MFKLIKKPEFTHDVPIMVPIDGGHRAESIKVRFRALPADELAEFDMNTPEGNLGYLRAITVSFEDVVGEDDLPLPPSDELRDTLLGMTFVRLGLIRAYSAAMTKASKHQSLI